MSTHLTPVTFHTLTAEQAAALCPSSHDLDDLGKRLLEVHLRIQRTQQELAEHAVKLGILLLLTKSRMPRGKWRAWLDEHFRKHRSSADRYMKLAAFFLDEKRVLLPELHGIEQLALGLPSPDSAAAVERKIKSFCGGHESLTELMRQKGVICQGGNRYERHDEQGNLIAGKGSLQAAVRAAEALPAQAREVWGPLQARLRHAGLVERSWVHLTRREIEDLHGLLLDVQRELSASLRGGTNPLRPVA